MSPYDLVPESCARSAAFAADADGAIDFGRFLADALALGARLPDAGYVVNLCADRYRFAVGFAAALLRRQVTLLPSSEAPAPLAALADSYDGSYFLHDGAPSGRPGAREFAFPRHLQGVAGASLPRLSPDQPAAVLFTSGSTGTPVPNLRSWGALVNSCDAATRALGLGGLESGHILGTVPHQHSFGLESVIMLALRNGFRIERDRPLLPADIVARLEVMAEPRILVTTPIHLRSLLAAPGALPRVHRIICATAPLSPELAREAEDRFAAELHEIYGCSEVGQMAVRRTTRGEEWSCIDGIALAERDGEVWASGAAAATAAPLNDVIELRGPDRFVLHGRKSDMINIAGKRNSLAHLNHVLNQIEGVSDGVFVMPADGVGVTRLTAYAVAPGLSVATILGELRRHIDPAFLPRRVHLVDALPRNALGKLTRGGTEQLVESAPGVDGAWSCVTLRFDAEHPTAAGHFPGNPVIPGALMLDHVIRAVSGLAAPVRVRAAKFLRPARPGQGIEIRWRRIDNGDVGFEVRDESGDALFLVGALAGGAT